MSRLKNDTSALYKKYLTKTSINQRGILVDSAIVKFQLGVWPLAKLWRIAKQRYSYTYIYRAVVHKRVKISMGEKWLSLQRVKVVKILV